MSQQEPEQQPEKKEYPGGIQRWEYLRTLAAGAAESGATTSERIALEVAVELAGLNYILDGIRYSARSRAQ